MKPHHAYRASVMLIPLGVLMIVAEAWLGRWLGVTSGVVIVIAGAVNVIAARRRGYGWHAPKTFREARAMEAERGE